MSWFAKTNSQHNNKLGQVQDYILAHLFYLVNYLPLVKMQIMTQSRTLWWVKMACCTAVGGAALYRFLF